MSKNNFPWKAMMDKQTGIDCPAITDKLRSCPIPGEVQRNGYCHVHDPKGKQAQKSKNKTPGKKQIKAVAKEKRLREEIAKEIEALCYISGTSIDCSCDFHRAAKIARR